MKMKNLLLGIALAAITQVTFGQYITGTPHDMSTETWNTGTTNKLCGTCHVPHNSMTLAQAPLWSHDTSNATYTMYTSAVSSTFNATPGTRPDGNSKLCLSCHDGTVALNDFIGAQAPVSGTMGTVYPGTLALVGTNLSNDHPISFTYDAALVTADGGLHPITTNVPALGGTIAAKMLYAGKMQCASCHNAHNNQYTNFQRMSNANSQLCLACHNK
jgi:predicted CXXCH cytochrome family protein